MLNFAQKYEIQILGKYSPSPTRLGRAETFPKTEFRISHRTRNTPTPPLIVPIMITVIGNYNYYYITSTTLSIYFRVNK